MLQRPLATGLGQLQHVGQLTVDDITPAMCGHGHRRQHFGSSFRIGDECHLVAQLIEPGARQPALCASIGQFTGTDHDGFVIITADAQGGLVDVHDRRPVVLGPELAREWIAAEMPAEQAEQMVLNLGEPADAFEWFRVGVKVGNVRNQGPELIQPF